MDKMNVIRCEYMIRQMLTEKPEDEAHSDFQTELWMRIRQSDYRRCVEQIFDCLPYEAKERLDEQTHVLCKKRGWEL